MVKSGFSTPTSAPVARTILLKNIAAGFFFRETAAAAAKPEFRASWHWSLGALFTLNWYPLSTMMWEGGCTLIYFCQFNPENGQFQSPKYEEQDSLIQRSLCQISKRVHSIIWHPRVEQLKDPWSLRGPLIYQSNFCKFDFFNWNLEIVEPY